MTLLSSRATQGLYLALAGGGYLTIPDEDPHLNALEEVVSCHVC